MVIAQLGINPVRVPDEGQEALRDLVRTLEELIKDLSEISEMKIIFFVYFRKAEPP